MFKSTKYNIATITAIIVLIIELRLCDYMFPWTGLGAIMVVPFIYLICIGLILFTRKISKNKTRLQFKFIWIALILINTLISTRLYIQEFRPSVWQQIVFTFDVIKNSDTIKEEDLELYKVSNFTRYDCIIIDSRERYIAALKKFKHKIPRDGSHLLYGRKNLTVIETTDIKSNLKTGQDRLIWWLIRQ